MSWNQYISSLGGVINPARKIRYGGINNLRGYRDNQFRSSKISIQTIEIHLQKSPFFRTLFEVLLLITCEYIKLYISCMLAITTLY